MDDELNTVMQGYNGVEQPTDDDEEFWSYARASFKVNDFLRLTPINLQSPSAMAAAVVASHCQSEWALDIDLDTTIIATTFMEDPRYHQVPYRANVAHSMSLTQALLTNWQQNGSGDWFDHLGHLQGHHEQGFDTHIVAEKLPAHECVAYEAIYRVSSPQRYDATTQLPIRADRFKQFIWNQSQQSVYLTYLQRFWEAYSDDYRDMLKAALLKAAYIQAEQNTLTVEHKNMVLDAIGIARDQDWGSLSFDTLELASGNGRVTLSELLIHGYRAADIMVIRSVDSPQVLLYIPGNSSPIHGFKNENELKDWVAALCRHPGKRRAFEAHFSAADDADGFFYSGLHTALEGIAVWPKLLNSSTGAWNPRKIVQFSEPLQASPFQHFKDRIKAKSQEDAIQISTHAEYWTHEAAVGLVGCLTVVGPLAIVFPEALPVVIGLSLALIGLGSYEAITGHTLKERQQGVGHAVFGVLNALPLLGKGARAVETGVETGLVEVETLPGDYEVPGATDVVKPQPVPVFRPEPPGLRSLDAKMRRLLRNLEAPQEIPGLMAGEPSGIHRVDGKSFIELHDQAYRVEWVPQERQYRIRSAEDPRTWGPFVRIGDQQYWDLDLRLGLRGGESFDGSRLPGVDAGPSVPEPAVEPMIQLQPRDLKIQVELPLDGISIEQVASRETGVIKEKYFIVLNGRKTGVYYDADNFCWQVDSATPDPVWLDKSGEWKTGQMSDFRKVEAKLPQSRRFEIYHFPRLPRLPTDAQPISRVIHHIWMGERAPGAGLLENIQRNMRVSPDLRFEFHIDIDEPGAFDQLSEHFSGYPNMRISRLTDEPFYADFLSGENGEAFNYFRHAENRNYAAASDILRYRLVNEYGGIYMDCDDTIARSFADVPLKAAPHDVLLGARLDSESLSYRGPGNSHFASHPDNPVLKRVLDEIKVRFDREKLDNKAFFSARRPFIDNTSEALRSASKARMKPYMTRISELTGPKLFSDVLRITRPDYFDLLDRSYVPIDEVLSVPYIDRLNDAVDFYFPFKGRAKIQPGSSNDW